jgi:hypothetical protein
MPRLNGLLADYEQWMLISALEAIESPGNMLNALLGLPPQNVGDLLTQLDGGEGFGNVPVNASFHGNDDVGPRGF